MDIPQISVALIQCAMNTSGQTHLRKIAQMISEATKKGASIVCLPELFASPYFCQEKNSSYYNVAEPIPGPLSQFLSEQAKINRISLVGGSIYELDHQGSRYNTSLVFNQEGVLVLKYRKMHIPHDPNYWEQYYFTPGNLGYPNNKINDITLGTLICYDQWFPEPTRIHALSGTQLLCYPTAIGWTDQMRKEEPWSAQRWEDAMRSHASMNGIFTAGINRVGIEANIEFWGGSFIADPFGQIIARASPNKEEILIATLDMGLIIDSQEGWGFLHNRRPETYEQLIKKKDESKSD
jgi:N-carbamoylputrescine amidase